MSSQIMPLNESGFPLLNDSVRPLSTSPLARIWDKFSRLVTRIAATLPLWAWCVPCLAMALLFLASGPCLSWFVGKYAWTGKDFQEILGPSLLGAAVAVAGFQSLLRTSVCRTWMLCIPVALLCRELHFSGTGTGVYVALVAIIWFGFAHAARLQPIWNCRNVCGCLFSAACLYALAVSVDSGVWKFLPLSQWWGVNLEETLESIGHLMILGSSLCGVMLVDRRGSSALTLDLPIRGSNSMIRTRVRPANKVSAL